ncbi:hypothetical protein [Helicobacter pylori]|uniref:hypothetical protein n=1 Tax=Helicobacter pylori TaxID=210 RepID=UPI001934B1B1|nr:hypothetical protein [Helicobacter pylori]MBS3011970.1 hypothetical protein [Helicobacter pylori]MBS3013201.1 hypothetical protein [Helicobacter pylori]
MLKAFLQSIIKELAEFEIFFKMIFKMTKQKNPILKIKVLVSQSQKYPYCNKKNLKILTLFKNKP